MKKEKEAHFSKGGTMNRASYDRKRSDRKILEGPMPDTHMLTSSPGGNNH